MIFTKYDYQYKFLKYLKKETIFKDFYDGKDLFERAKIQSYSNKKLEEKEKKKDLKENKLKLNKSCLINNSKITLPKMQSLKEKNKKEIQRKSINNNIESYIKTNKIKHFFKFKLLTNKNQFKKINSKRNNSACNKYDKNETEFILFGKKLSYLNNNKKKIIFKKYRIFLKFFNFTNKNKFKQKKTSNKFFQKL